jgi:hypothetical protein
MYATLVDQAPKRGQVCFKLLRRACKLNIDLPPFSLRSESQDRANVGARLRDADCRSGTPGRDSDFQGVEDLELQFVKSVNYVPELP